MSRIVVLTGAGLVSAVLLFVAVLGQVPFSPPQPADRQGRLDKGNPFAEADPPADGDSSDEDPFAPGPDANPFAPGEDENPFAPGADENPFAPGPDEAKPAAEPDADDSPSDEPARSKPQPPPPRRPASRIVVLGQTPVGKFRSAEEAIEKTLAQPVTLELLYAPCCEVVDVLREKFKLNLVVDRRRINAAGVDVTAPVTLDRAELTLDAALELMLGQIGLAHTIHNEVVFISTQRHVASLVSTRLYPVGDLVGDKGPSGKSTTLVVTQTRANHRQIAELLALLRRIAKDTAAGKTAPHYGGAWDRTPAAAAIEKALASPVTLDFVETPLDDVRAFISRSHGINVLLDKKSLDDWGIAADTPVTYRAKGVTLGSALRLMLRELDLTWLVRDEVLLITTPETAETYLPLGVYPVGDLVRGRDESGRITYDFDALIDVITSAVCPFTWDKAGGPGSIGAAPLAGVNALVVTQTAEVHEGVGQLLATLRKAANDHAAGKSALRYGAAWEPTPARQAIEKVLNTKVKLDFQKTPLQGVVDSLRDSHGINVQLDKRALDDVGIATDVPVTFHAKGISLRSALRLMLEDLDLTWIIRYEALLITPPERAEEQIFLGVYPVADLAEVCDQSGGTTYGFPLADAITSTVCPARWEGSGPSSIAGAKFAGVPTLLVPCDLDMHEQVGWLLTAMRTAESRAAEGKPLQADVPCDCSPEEAAVRRAIDKALDGRFEHEFRQTPLIGVVAYLRQVTATHVCLDLKALDDAGIAPDAPVSLEVCDISIRSALDLVLDQIGLDWAFRHESLVITTPEEARRRLAIKIYPVAKLVTVRDESGELWDDYDTLMDVVETISPASWSSTGGCGATGGVSLRNAKVLIVAHTDRVHRQVGRLLEQLRTIAAKRPGHQPPLRKRPPPRPKLASEKQPQKADGGTGGGFF